MLDADAGVYVDADAGAVDATLYIVGSDRDSSVGVVVYATVEEQQAETTEGGSRVKDEARAGKEVLIRSELLDRTWAASPVYSWDGRRGW
jgi:hypothetical protein